jgi:hypothetical protein
MRLAWVTLVCAALVACGGDDDSGAGGTGGTAGSTGGAAGASGGAAGAGGATGGAAGQVGAGGAFSCKASTNQYPNVDCKSACAHFTTWGSTGSCANPYAGDPQCELACDTVKNSGPYVNALFGCAGDNADCAGWKACLALICG